MTISVKRLLGFLIAIGIDFVGIIKLISFFSNKKVRIIVLDSLPAHTVFSKLLLQDWHTNNIILIKTYKKVPNEYCYKNCVRITNYSILRRFRADYLITFASHLRKNTLPKNVMIIHLPHSLVSLHDIYSKLAFADYDHIFACGPHHFAEFHLLSDILNWENKFVHKIGYIKVDRLAKEASVRNSDHSKKTIILAPSWGVNNLLETSGEKIVTELLTNGWKVIVRPHPLTRVHSPEIIEKLNLIKINHTENLIIEGEYPDIFSMLEADVMISDWSGVAYEFAFGLGKPVVFIDRSRKKVNSNDNSFLNLDFPCMEVEVRNKVGVVCTEDQILENITILYSDLALWHTKISAVRDEYLYNFGSSQNATIEKINEITHQL